MTSSKILIEQIKTFETCQCTAYKCPAGVWTIGYGHTQGVKKGQKITRLQAYALLKLDLKEYETYVSNLNVCKTQGQFDALVDFAYNCGKSALGSSTLLKYIKQGKSTEDIQAQFLRWNKSKGKVLAGLTKRREWEAKRWCE